MPSDVTKLDGLKPGEIYEDAAYHPCLCVKVSEGEVTGISLVDGSYPRSGDLGVGGIRKLTPEEAWHWRIHGPRDVEVPMEFRWWK